MIFEIIIELLILMGPAPVMLLVIYTTFRMLEIIDRLCSV